MLLLSFFILFIIAFEKVLLNMKLVYQVKGNLLHRLKNGHRRGLRIVPFGTPDVEVTKLLQVLPIITLCVCSGTLK